MLPYVPLENDAILLRPLQSGDWKQLTALTQAPDLWKFFPWDLSDEKRFEEWMEHKVAAAKVGSWYPFLVIRKKTNTPVGITCYLNVDEPNLCLEIGGTWYGAPYHGTEVNPNAKLLLMTYAFDTLGYERVELKTDVLNLRSRRAMLKLGAQEEGILRSKVFVHDNRRRDTIYYSVLKSEWPQIKLGLTQRITQYQ
jgi:N-acetyltransferase